MRLSCAAVALAASYVPARAFRGIVVSGGDSQVRLRYAPGSIIGGAILTLLAFSGTLLMFLLDWLKRMRKSKVKEWWRRDRVH
jgi:hypothetical protein